MNKILFVIVAVLIAAGAIWLGWSYFRDKELADGYPLKSCAMGGGTLVTLKPGDTYCPSAYVDYGAGAAPMICVLATQPITVCKCPIGEHFNSKHGGCTH